MPFETKIRVYSSNKVIIHCPEETMISKLKEQRTFRLAFSTVLFSLC